MTGRPAGVTTNRNETDMSVKRTVQITVLALALTATGVNAASAASRDTDRADRDQGDRVVQVVEKAQKVRAVNGTHDQPDVQNSESEESFWEWFKRRIIGTETAGEVATKSLCESGRFDKGCDATETETEDGEDDDGGEEGGGESDFWDPGDGSCDDPFVLC